jgi:hypothetical protein
MTEWRIETEVIVAYVKNMYPAKIDISNYEGKRGIQNEY